MIVRNEQVFDFDIMHTYKFLQMYTDVLDIAEYNTIKTKIIKHNDGMYTEISELANDTMKVIRILRRPTHMGITLRTSFPLYYTA